MLLRFAVENHLSFRDRQELSLVASNLKERQPSMKPSEEESYSVLPVAVVYGANAAGKTSLIRNFQFMRSAVLYSHSKGSPEGGVPRNPFLLDPDCSDTPSTFEADFIVDGIRHHYGFEVSDNDFPSEWLYTFPAGKRRKIFERMKGDVDFGTTFKGQKKILVDLMRPNSLFLSTATQNDHEYLTQIVRFFRQTLFNSSISVAKNTISKTFKKDEIDDRSIDFLRRIGTGVVSHRKNEVEVDEAVRNIAKEFVVLARRHFGENFSDEDLPASAGKEVHVELAHTGKDGTEHFLPLDMESSGTRRLLVVLNKVFRALDHGTLMMIDELDASLHTFAAEALLGLFCDPSTNRYGAQLVATTHDTNLMSSQILRRDEIWFAEKDETGATHLFPLSDIKARQGDDFEKGYLQGRYGAIPFSGDISRLFGVTLEEDQTASTRFRVP